MVADTSSNCKFRFRRRTELNDITGQGAFAGFKALGGGSKYIFLGERFLFSLYVQDRSFRAQKIGGELLPNAPPWLRAHAVVKHRNLYVFTKFGTKNLASSKPTTATARFYKFYRMHRNGCVKNQV